ncbi:MAG TPA: hypothetical protein PKA27_10280 [Fimbriimonadaceae bacterium]|nr:hypothetical protein [Fimbriimonadaceae bacterium]
MKLQRTVQRLGRFVVLGALLATVCWSFSLGLQNREETAIKWIARTLNRLGEPALANRLWTDFRKGRIRFVQPSELDGDNAQVSQDSKGNFIELNNFALQVADQEKLLGVNPYGPKSINLVMISATLVHEYVHMGQVKPSLTPKFEDPAWQYSDKNYKRWYQRLKGELEAAKKLPPSAERTKKVSEIVNLLNRLAESAQGDAAELPSKIGDYLSTGLSWNLLSGLPQSILKTAKEGESWLAAAVKSAPTTSATTVPKGGAWVLLRVDSGAPPPRNDYDQLGFTFTTSPGSAQGSWHRGDDPSIRTNLKMTWNAPPAVIEPGKEFTVTFNPSDSGSSPGASGFVSVATALYFCKALEAPWEFKGQGRPAYAALGEPMKPQTVTYTAPAGVPNNVMAFQVNTGTSLIGGWIHNYLYVYKK